MLLVTNSTAIIFWDLCTVRGLCFPPFTLPSLADSFQPLRRRSFWLSAAIPLGRWNQPEKGKGALSDFATDNCPNFCIAFMFWFSKYVDKLHIAYASCLNHSNCVACPLEIFLQISHTSESFFLLLKMKKCKEQPMKKTGLKVINMVQVTFRCQFQYFRFSYTFFMNLEKK